MERSETRDQSNSRDLFERAKKVMPGGVNSPVRAFKAVGGVPPFITHGVGSKIYDEDGNRYIDYVGSWGPLILGHADPASLDELIDRARLGFSFGAPTRLEVELAELIVELVPSIEMVRLVNSGSEATMSAIRLARAHTGRAKILKFDGHYHGHADSLLVAAGSGVETLKLPDSPGVPEPLARLTISARYNDLDSIRAIFERDGDEIAAIILEPIMGNMGLIKPREGFLAGLRAIADRYGALLIFDEVMTGFRVALGGAQERYGVRPDLTTLGKVIGGGAPVGAYGGAASIMKNIAPEGAVYQAGTLSGNPLGVALGLSALRTLKSRPEAYDELEAKGKRLIEGIRSAFEGSGIRSTFDCVGSMFGFYFLESGAAPTNYDEAKLADTARFARFHAEALERSIYFAPSQFEAGFISLAHTDEEIETTIEAAREIAPRLAEPER